MTNSDICIITFFFFLVPYTTPACVDWSINQYCRVFANEKWCQHPRSRATIQVICPRSCKVCETPEIQPNEESLEEYCLGFLNEKRRRHLSTTDLRWDRTIEKDAQIKADESNDGVINYSPYNWYGKTDYVSIQDAPGTNKAEICRMAVEKWYSERSKFDIDNPGRGNFFTQLIWRSSTNVGVGISTKFDGSLYYTYVVAYYYKLGNVKSFFNNVMPLRRTIIDRVTEKNIISNTIPTTQSTKSLVTLKRGLGTTFRKLGRVRPTRIIPTTKQVKITLRPTLRSLPATTQNTSTHSNEGACLPMHNEKRRLHQATSDLIYDIDIEVSAQKWADYLARTNKFDHDPNNRGFGENLAYSFHSHTINTDQYECEDAIKRWYDEINLYDYQKPGFSKETGHFTQVVWKTTTRVGVGIARSSDRKKVFVVARYSPPGNYLGRFRENVAPLK